MKIFVAAIGGIVGLLVGCFGLGLISYLVMGWTGMSDFEGERAMTAAFLFGPWARSWAWWPASGWACGSDMPPVSNAPGARRPHWLPRVEKGHFGPAQRDGGGRHGRRPPSQTNTVTY
jgi:hypothetical protein